MISYCELAPFGWWSWHYSVNILDYNTKQLALQTQSGKTVHTISDMCDVQPDKTWTHLTDSW